MGVDFSEFNPKSLVLLTPGLLYYKDGRLTDNYYIYHVYTVGDTGYTNEGTHYVYVLGEAKEGDYLTTCPIRGAAMVTDNEEIAFARVTEGRVPTLENEFPPVGACYATFLQH